MLAGSGVRGDMTDYAVVCDEIQILGDETRGRSIEVLLTLLRQASWGQLIGLSAVLDPVDATALADWLGVRLIQCPTREKHLLYECRTATHIHVFDTGATEAGVQSRARKAHEPTDTAGVVRELIAQPEHRPVVVFCMSCNRFYELAAELAGFAGTDAASGQPLLPGFDDDTAAARELSLFMRQKVAFHTSDLRENERRAPPNFMIVRATRSRSTSWSGFRSNDPQRPRGWPPKEQFQGGPYAYINIGG